MSMSLLRSRRMAARFGLLGLLSIVLTLPYAVPALWDVVEMRLGFARDHYLLKPAENQLYYVQFAAVLVGVPYLLWSLWSPPRGLFRNSIVFLALAFVALQFASTVNAGSAGFTLRMLLFPAALLFLFLLIQSLDLSRDGIQKFFLVAVIGVIPAAVYTLAQSRGYEILPYSRFVSESTFEEVSGKQLISSTFGHPNYMASYIAPLLFWALFFSLSRGWRLRKIAGAASAVLILAALIVGGTRGGWLGVVVGAVPFYVLLTFSPAYRRQLLFAGGLGVLLVIVALFLPLPFLKVRFDLAERLLASKEITERFYYWMIALEMFKEHWLLGVGYANYNVLFWDTVSLFQERESSEYFRFILTDNVRGVAPIYVHNDYLQIATETGALGILTWLALWSAFLVQAWEIARRLVRDQVGLLLAATFLASLTAFAVDSLFNFPVHIPVSGTLFWVTLGSWVVFRGIVARRFVEVSPSPVTPRSIPRVRLPAGPKP
jgi:O-antigen ligase